MNICLATGYEKLEEGLSKKLKGKGYSVYQVFFREAEVDGCDVAVVSPSLPGEKDIIDMVYDLRQRDIRVILLAGAMGKEEVWRAFNLGVYDILFDPVREEDIIQAIGSPKTFKETSTMLSRMGIDSHAGMAIREISVEKVVVKEVKKVIRQQIFVWWSASGGEGKTTLAVSQAYQIAKATGEKVALLDFKEVTPGCFWYLDVIPYDVMPVYDAIENGGLTEAVLEDNMAEYKRCPNLRLFTGVGLDRFEIFSERHFSAILDVLQGYPYVVIDTNPGIFFAGTAVALRKADIVNVVVEPTYRSLDDTLRMIRFVDDKWGVSKGKVKVFVNKARFNCLDTEIINIALRDFNLKSEAVFDYKESVIERLNSGMPPEAGFEALLKETDIPIKDRRPFFFLGRKKVKNAD